MTQGQLGIAWGAEEPPAPVLLVFEVVDERPRPKGNLAARAYPHRPDGQDPPAACSSCGVRNEEWRAMIYDPDKNSPWRKAVRAAAAGARTTAKLATIPFAVVLEVVFFFERPANHHRGNDIANPLKADAPRYPVSHQCGDLGKLLRAIEDEITEAKVWADDSLVVSYGGSTKLWSDRNRAVVRIVAAL